MSPEAQRTAIAEACGWKAHVDGLGYYQGVHPALMGGRAIPDYLADLNAMHKAEKVLTSKQKQTYATALSDALSDSAPTESCHAVWAETIHATAAQRAEAFLRTIGKWETAK